MRNSLPYLLIFSIIISVVLSSCNTDDKNDVIGANSNEASANGFGNESSKMKLLSSSETKVDFVNTLKETNQVNFYFDQYIYNGGGVSIGDINNDGMPDLFFTGNQVENRLYLNKGNLSFEDISKTAGVQKGGWSNGVSVVDINNDGFLDFYVCRGGTLEKDLNKRRNQLFVNNGENGFVDQANSYGIDDPSYSLHSAFLDFDLDGDLDLYVTNYPTKFKIGSETINSKMKNPGPYESDKFYRNNGNGKFTDVSKEVGVANYGHGLGIGVCDLNMDGYPDIYIANDYTQDDFYYRNVGGTKFVEEVRKITKHTSQFSMGMDIADINNDMLVDIMTADMSAEDNFRSKAMMPSMDTDDFWENIKQGRHFQYMRNSLQLNTGANVFSEIGQMAGLDKTDWSWAPLFLDLDNDGFQDLYVTNGYMRDMDEKDANKRLKKVESKLNRQLRWDDVLEEIKSTKLSNYVFKNNGNLTFSKMNKDWINTPPSFSNGLSYGDLDNDGDLDLVCSNLNDPAFVIENKASGNYVKIKLNGPPNNKLGIGAKILVKCKDGIQYREQYLSRGYLSSVDPIILIGLGNYEKIDEIIVKWHDQKETILKNSNVNETYELNYAEAIVGDNILRKKDDMIFTPVESFTKINYKHAENFYDDYEKQVLLPHKLSQMGPHISSGDLTGDGLIDMYIGGAKGKPGSLFVQRAGAQFDQYPLGSTSNDYKHEEMGSVFFDLENDGDLDLYIVSGGYERGDISALQDRLYINNNGNLQAGKLPEIKSSGSCVVSWDYNNDGFQDLFVGGRVIPDEYPKPASSYLLQNKSGSLVDVTESDAAFFKELGMVTSAVAGDIDGDGVDELIVVGDWMEIKVLKSDKNGIKDVSKKYNLDDSRGWWNKIVKQDLDNDGDDDYVLGNLGLNYKYKASKKEPFKVYSDDFDDNGTYDIVLGYYYNGDQYPVRGLQCSSEQMPFVKEDFPNYNDFALSNINEIYGSKLKGGINYEISSFSSIILWNENGKLVRQELPIEAQISPVYGIVVDDFNKDGNQDIAYSGNLMVSEVETGNADAGFGGVLLGNGGKSFTYSNPFENGLVCPFDVRDMHGFKINEVKSLIVVANNNMNTQVYGYNSK